MRTIVIEGDGRRFKRKAYADIGRHPDGDEEVFDIDYKQWGTCQEEVRISYPQYVRGRQGEAFWVHLPSFPSRILHRALTGKVEEGE